MHKSNVGADLSATSFRVALARLALLLPLITPTPSQSHPQDTFTIPSAATADTRHINVYKPPGYDTSAASYPVLYMPDGGLQEDFPHVAKAVDEGIKAGEIAPILVVGIENTERRRDMTGPTDVASDKQIAPRVGGSAAFRKFIANELIPEVGRRYRVNTHRGIIGESLAGLFAVESFLQEPALFDTVIAISPSLWWNHASLVHQGPQLLAAPSGPRRLYLTSADEDNIAPNVATLASLLPRTQKGGLQWHYVPRPQEHHDSIYLASEADALRWSYPADKTAGAGRRVLFVGNSLTYVNDLPAAFASLAKPGAPVQADMIAFGGATLAEHVARGLVASALEQGQYTDVILQERGGEAFCPADCQQSPDAALGSAGASVISLAELARRHGARVFYLGTWQADRQADVSLEFGERRIAKQAGATYIEIAEPRRKLLERYPSFNWTRPDGQHPGKATTALVALRTWQAVYGTKATAIPCVGGPPHVAAPEPNGIWHVDPLAMPRTCLVSRGQMALLSDPK